jgi:hypothetical protein
MLRDLSRDLNVSIASFILGRLKFDTTGKKIGDPPPPLPHRHENAFYIEHVRYLSTLRKRAEAIVAHSDEILSREQDSLMASIDIRLEWLEFQRLQQWHMQFPSCASLDPYMCLPCIFFSFTEQSHFKPDIWSTIEC